MRKTIITTIILLAATMNMTVKGTKSDSLKAVIQQQQGEEKLKSMENLFMAAYAENDEALQTETAKQIIEEAKEQKNEKYEGYGRISLLCIYYNHGRSTELENALAEHRNFYERTAMWDYYYYSSWLMASLHFNSGLNYTALQEAEEMYKDARKRNYEGGMIEAYLMMGDVYHAMNDHQRALENYQTATQRLEKREKTDRTMMCNVYYGLSKTLADAKRFEDIRPVTEKWKKSIDEWKADIKRQKKDTVSVNIRYMYCYLAIAEMERGLGNIAKSEEWLKKAEKLGEGQSDIIRSALVSGREEYYRAKGDYERALEYNKESYRLSVAISDSVGAIDAQQNRAELLMLSGRKAEAADIYQRLFALKDSIYSESNRSELNEMNTLYHVKDAMVEAQRKIDERKIWIMGMALAFSIIAIATLFYFTRRQRKMVERLQKANERARESAKMKESIIRNMSHEIRTPLNIISGFTQAMNMPGVKLEEEERKDMVERIEQSTESIISIINNLLELSHLESMTSIERDKTIGCNKLCQIAITDSHIASTESTTFTFDSELADDVTIQTNVDSAAKALTELLVNAMKFTSEGHIRLHATQKKDKVLFTVEDTGKGIPLNEQKHVFETFVKLDDFTLGVGTGLSMSRMLIRRLGGTLQIDPEYTTGCRITITLPMGKVKK